MAITVTHATVATGTDAGNGEIRKSHWNENHAISGIMDIVNGGTGASTARAAAQSLSVPYIFAQSGTAVSVGAVTTETVLATISFAGGELGPNGYIQVIPHFSCTNNANVKTGFVRLGGAAGTQYMSTTLTSLAGVVRYVSIFNNNSQSAQKSPSPAGQGVGFGTFSSVGVTSTVNTAAAWDLVISAQKANTADTLTLEGYQILVCYGA